MNHNKYFDMDCLELNIAIANLHPIAMNWISDLLMAVRFKKNEMLIMELIIELMMYPEPLDTFYIMEAMWLNPEEVDYLRPIVSKIMANPDYYIAEFSSSSDAQIGEDYGNVDYNN